MNIDFLIIGAQKSGTTSLFRYLSSHPDIYIPPQKEVSFFSHEANFVRGKEWYLSQYFGTSDGKVKGEASPQYMCFDEVPCRISKMFPNTKLIAILRNPLDRSYSHYSMSKRRGIEKLSYKKAIEKAISRSKSGAVIDTNFDYVRFGEYGRILSHYLKYFDKSQIKIVFMEDLAASSLNVTKEIYQFLGVNDQFRSQITGKKFHEGGGKRVVGLDKKVFDFLRRLSQTRVASRFVSKNWIEGVIFWVETELNVKPSVKNNLSIEERCSLVEHYRDDVKLLESLFNIKTPWPEFV